MWEVNFAGCSSGGGDNLERDGVTGLKDSLQGLERKSAEESTSINVLCAGVPAGSRTSDG